MTKIIKRLQWRWRYQSDPWPQEIETGIPVPYIGDREDAEKHLILRRLRAVLFGYGWGWTFKDAAIRAMEAPLLIVLWWSFLFALWLFVRGVLS